jgi:DNA-binding transcriptional MocR family regulator
LEERLSCTGVAKWKKPNGGYFISVDLMNGCAAETVRLLKEAGVVLTGAGATYPYGKDTLDRNIRIAPTFPPLAELKTAMELLCTCVQIVAVRKLLGE